MASLGQTTPLEVQQQIVTLYSEGLSISLVGERLGINKSTVSKWVKHHGGQIRDAKVARRIYTHNEEAFSRSSPEASYWLGFLLADGCVLQPTRGSLRLVVALADRDEYHLEQLRSFLGYTAPLTRDTRKGQVRIVLPSDAICNALIQKGCHPNKSLTLTFPDNGYFHSCHFIRGFFDGDGGIYYNEKVYCQPTFSIVGPKDFLADLQDVLVQEADMSKTKIYPHNASPVHYLSYTSRNNVQKMYDYLYEHGGPHLERKKHKFEYALAYHDRKCLWLLHHCGWRTSFCRQTVY